MAWFETMLPQVLTLIGMVVVLFAVDPGLGLAALVVLPALACVSVVFQRRINGAEGRTRSLTGALASRAAEVLRNVRVVQAFSRARDEEQRFRAASEQTTASAVQAIELEARFYPLADVVLAVGRGLVLFVGILQVVAGHLPVGTLLVVLAYVSSLYAPVEDLSEFASLLARSTASGQRLAEILGSEELVPQAPDALDAPPGAPALVLRDVGFSYRAGIPALSDVWLEVSPGEVLSLVGPSGAGKSTLLALLLRLYDPEQGSVEYNGLDLRRLTLRSLRERIALVPQNPWILDGTIEENIAFGRPGATAEDVARAADVALVDEFARRLPDGYATNVGEGGALLSGGQRRRIALARAVVREEARCSSSTSPRPALTPRPRRRCSKP
ncbi:MAG: hypothetical protein QOH66_1487 [Actinomycetota bacterium]|nr:hypothetical protein [Actinomycetota bacterium]